MISTLRRIFGSSGRPGGKREQKIAQYFKGGHVPWSPGYEEYKWREIAAALENESLTRGFAAGRVPEEWGRGLDERIVEYPWLFAKLAGNPTPFWFHTNRAPRRRAARTSSSANNGGALLTRYKTLKGFSCGQRSSRCRSFTRPPAMKPGPASASP
jgi:hypothetical protein